MTPPLALFWSASIGAAHLPPSAVIAQGRAMAEENPTLMGGPLCAPAPGWSPSIRVSTAAIPIALRRISVIAPPLLISGTWAGPAAEDREVLPRPREPPGPGGSDLDGVLHLDAAPAVLVVGRLHAEHHARLERHARRRIDGGRIVWLEGDARGHLGA